MRVVICWTDISGYMAACWRALASQPGIDHLHVIAFTVGSGEINTQFSESLMAGISCDLFNASQRQDHEAVLKRIADHQPDAIVLPGWAVPVYCKVPFDPRFNSARFYMTMDTPFTGSLRQRLGRFRVGSYLKRMSGVICGGERAGQLARWLGVPEDRISTGMYGFDAAPLESLLKQRMARPDGWPKRFVYVGRYVQDKAIEVLAAGYQKYRDSVTDPWPLHCYGKGPDAGLLQGIPGIEDHGFVQPVDLPGVLESAGAYVIASRFEPWGVSIAEAAYSGLPILCSNACGAAVEMVRHLYSGYVFPTGQSAQLAAGFRWMHEYQAKLSAMGNNSKHLAAAFTADQWAKRWGQMLAGTD